MSIYKLYYHPICPFSRQVQVVLYECKIKFAMQKIDYWKEIEKIVSLNPAGEIPILLIDDFIIVDSINIIEYMSHTNRLKIFDEDLRANCEIKRLNSWCNIKLYREVIKIFIDEKIIKPQLINSSPNTEVMRIARKNLSYHFKYFTTLLKRREWLASDNFTASDIVLSSHISVLDYLNEMNWENYPLIKQFYSLVKSRPSFKTILEDNVIGITPPSHYLLLDF
jgi:glutathione S-transferase